MNLRSHVHLRLIPNSRLLFFPPTDRRRCRPDGPYLTTPRATELFTKVGDGEFAAARSGIDHITARQHKAISQLRNLTQWPDRKKIEPRDEHRAFLSDRRGALDSSLRAAGSRLVDSRAVFSQGLQALISTRSETALNSATWLKATAEIAIDSLQPWAPVSLSVRNSTTRDLSIRSCLPESRSRTVTVPSSLVWPSTVKQYGVPASLMLA
jgi:hypothetical protein